MPHLMSLRRDEMTYNELRRLEGKTFTVVRANGKPDFAPFEATLIGTEAGLLELRRADGSRYWAETYNCRWPE
jgi:hypothetical protein